MTRDPLYELSCRYAQAADRRDANAFADVFLPEGSLTVVPPAGSGRLTRTRRGRAELAAVTEALARFDRTYHLLGQAVYERAEDTATGEVYCIAHHLTGRGPGTGDEPEDHVMYIRYADEYALTEGGDWRISHRTVQVDWTDARRVTSGS